jgi:hypothetical protein
MREKRVQFPGFLDRAEASPRLGDILPKRDQEQGYWAQTTC